MRMKVRAEYTVNNGKARVPDRGEPMMAVGLRKVTPARVAERLMRSDGYSTIGYVTDVQITSDSPPDGVPTAPGVRTFFKPVEVRVTVEAVIDEETLQGERDLGDGFLRSLRPKSFIELGDSVFISSCEFVNDIYA